jgi:hypothetical protein
MNTLIITPEMIVDNNDPVLHLCYGIEDDDNYVYEELTIPETIEVFISDLSTKKLIIPFSLKVLDLHPTVNTDLDFNMTNSIKDIIIRYTNILNKSLMELFPPNCRYRYTQCNLNGIPIVKHINELYKKYFGIEPVVDNTYNPNVVYYRNYSNIIEQIREYETRILQGKEFRLTIKEELVAMALHPDRICKWIEEFGIDIIEEI